MQAEVIVARKVLVCAEEAITKQTGCVRRIARRFQ